MDIVAHSGGELSPPGNSPDYFLAADKMGLSFIEFDVVLLGDTFFVAHDTKQAKEPWALPLCDMLPLLSSLATPLFCDVKSLGAEKELAAMMQGAGLASSLFCSHSAESLRRIKSALPDSLVGWSAPQSPETDNIVFPFPKSKSYVESSRERLPDVAHRVLSENGFDGIMCQWLFLSDELVSRLQRSGFFVNAWTVDDVKTARSIAAFGVDSITSNYPGKIEQAL